MKAYYVTSNLPNKKIDTLSYKPTNLLNLDYQI
jgi:hypothetical protein